LTQVRFLPRALALLERPTLLGAGIDESTALEIGPDGTWTVRGAGAVVVYDARRARLTAPGRTLGAVDVRIHLLPLHSTFDPATDRFSLPR